MNLWNFSSHFATSNWCWVTEHICSFNSLVLSIRCVQSHTSIELKCYTNWLFNTLTLFLLQKKWLVLNEQSIWCISMSPYAKKKLQMCSVTKHPWRRRQMCRLFSQILPVHSILHKMTCWLNNPFTVSFQLIGMYSYAKNKLQMCSVK